MENITLLELTCLNQIPISFIRAINSFRNDKSSFEFMNTDTFKLESVAETKDWLLYKIKKSYKLFLLVYNESCIGYLNLVDHGLGEGIKPGVELGIAVFPNFRGKGFSSSAIRQLLLIKGKLSAEFIIARILSTNFPSICLFENAGFVRVGSFPNIGKRDCSLLFYFLDLKQ